MSQHAKTAEEIKTILLASGASTVTVTDNSHLHAGHEGAKSGGGHFAVKVVNQLFFNKSRIQCHRMIYKQLNELFESGAIHALEVEAITEEVTS